MAQHAEHAVGSRSFSQRTAHLGEEVAKADDRFETHLHMKFDHGLGQLSDRHATDVYERPAASNETARDLAQLLARPEGVRQAIVLNEILTRPDHRWD